MENARPYKAKVNGHFEFDDISSNELDIILTGHKKFHILLQNRSFHAEVVAADYEKKSFRIKVNGNLYDVALEDAFDQLIKQLGFSTNVLHKIKDVKAQCQDLY